MKKLPLQTFAYALMVLANLVLSSVCRADADLAQTYTHQRPTHQTMDDNAFMTDSNPGGQLTQQDVQSQLGSQTPQGYDAYSTGLHADDGFATATVSHDYPGHTPDFSSRSSDDFPNHTTMDDDSFMQK